MTQPSALLVRLNAIGESLAHSGHALALIGLGSVGNELHRLDDYSDLDFFVIVEQGHKHHYIADLSWLERLAPVAYRFANTVDGYKLLFADGIFCEFAVFEPDELQSIPFAPGRLVWKRDDAPADLHLPKQDSTPRPPQTPEYLLGEALTNLYVGLGRDKRGEKLTAMRFIQSYAVDRLVELTALIEPEQTITRDRFSNERRFEQRHPVTARELPAWMQGYERNRESALAILAFLERHFEVNSAMAEAIRKLCA